MKKLFLLTMVAVVFMACGGETPLPKNDEKALKAATVEVAKMIGENRTKAEKAFSDAGFVQIETNDTKLPAARLAHKAPQLKADSRGESVMYVYGAQEGNTGDEAMLAIVNEGKTLIMVEAYYVDDNLYGVYASLYTGWTEKINRTYTTISDGLYAQLTSATKQWGGYINLFDDKENVYEDHDAFVAAIASANEVEVYEQGYAFTGEEYTGIFYTGCWANPDEAMREDMTKGGITAHVVYGYFVVADVRAAKYE